MMKMNTNVQFRKLIWNFLGTTINACMSLVYQVIVTRINGLEATGSFSVCFAFSLLVYTFVNLGSRVYEVADKDGNDDTYFTLKWVAAGFSLLFTFFYISISGYNEEKAILLVLLLLVRVVESFSDTIYAIWQKAERLDLVGISYVLKNCASIVIFALVDFLTHSVIISTLGMIAGTWFVYIIFDYRNVKVFHRLRFNRSRKDCVDLSTKIFYFIAFNFVAMLISNLPKIIADFRYTESQMGYFSILIMFPTFLTLLGQLLVQSFLTNVTALYRENKLAELNKMSFGMAGIMLAIGVFLCLCVYFIGAPILKFVYALDFEAYKLAMVIAIGIGITNALVYIVSAILTVMEKTRQQFYLNVAALIAEFGILYIGMTGNTITLALTAFFVAIIAELAIFAGYYLFAFKELCKKN